ncbi:sensor histidine kinase N-terminal domain-containing protein [Hoeflea sp. YIM 152468]|uniref:sensor histidine kinase n=1 Tax=Hoeflea sp. YIM 152468 TaxID=3031759 RepID=UPI0023DBEF9F|nr:sensor histidine kinase [Hoeflea sp. YIM 152468]MDF1609802.1 sensor histidine kinase N-terminal domain-containing protein [Hoeflea sp. YIM 152468]
MPSLPAGRFRSIAWRLTVLLTLLLTLAAAGTVVAALSYGQTAATRAFDRLLTGAALQIAERISVVEGETMIDIPLSAFGLLSLAAEDRIFYRIIAPDGETLTGDESFPLPEASGSESDPLLYDTVFSGEAVRAIKMQRFLAERAVRGPITVIVAQTLRARAELANEIVARAIIGVIVAGGVTLALALLAMHLALSPLRRIERALLARDPKDLTPFSTTTPREVEALVAAINRFMARLDRRVSAMQGFVADAAHQMRTPITALRAKTELAMEETDPRKLKALQRRIRDRAIGVSRLTDQLLSHALVTHRADSATLEQIDLRRVAVEAEREARRTGGAEGIELDLPADPVMVAGDAFSLREAARNLITNALAHGRPPVCLRVSVTSQGRALIAAHDQGPGMSPDQLQRIGQRFARDPSNAQSAGLGLAIVAEVAEFHQGTLRTAGGAGDTFEVGIELPLTAPAAPFSEGEIAQ